MLILLVALCMLISSASFINSLKAKKDSVAIENNSLNIKNNELAKKNIEIEEKYYTVLQNNISNHGRIEKLEKACSELSDRCLALSKRVNTLEEENKKIKRTLEFYNMVSPNFELKKPFSMKVVK